VILLIYDINFEPSLLEKPINCGMKFLMLDNESLYTFIEPYIQTVPTGSSEAVSIIDVDDIFKLV